MLKILPPATKLTDRHLRNCRVVEDREILLGLLPKGCRVAEIGVLGGDFSEKILKVSAPKYLLLADLFESDDWGWTNRFAAAGHEDFVRDRFQTQLAGGQVEVRRGLSWEVLSDLPDSSFDWIYIDAGHDYESVSRDLAAARTKVIPGGYLVMNDYIMYDPNHGTQYGVVHATNEFCLEHDWEVVWLALQEHLFNDVVLRQIR